MRLVDRTTFLTLPDGTIYAKGTPWAFDGLTIKHETANDDWWHLNPCWPQSEDYGDSFGRLDDMLKTGASYPMEDAVVRDGLFGHENPPAIFLVFERDDLLKLREMVDAAIAVAP